MHRQLKLAIWSGPVGFGLFGIGLLALARFVPPPAPGLDAEAIAAIYRDHGLRIGLGAIVMMFGASLFAPFFAAISMFLKRMEPSEGSPYSLIQAMCATIVVTMFFSGALLLAITAYRPERNAEITYVLNDITWIWFILPAPPAVFQSLVTGLAILGDRKRLLPRWLGFLTLWTTVIFVPVVLGVLFKSGPFAWNGLFSFWIGAGIVGVWANILAMKMLGAIKSGAWDAAA